VTLVELVTFEVTVSLIVNSAHEADDGIAVPPAVVNPEIVLIVALSSAVPIAVVPSAVFVES
jgi:hypothetical protein